MAATANENNELISIILSLTPLDDAIDFIRERLRVDEVFDEEDLIAWAEDNGFIKVED